MKHIKNVIAIILCVLIFVPSCFAFSAFAKGSVLRKADFAAGISNVIKEKKSNKAVSPQSSGEAYSLRLYGKLREINTDFSCYHPENILVCEDGRFFLNFSSKSEAKKCEQSLNNDNNVLFVCSDAPVYTDEIEESEPHLSYGPESMNTDSFCEAYANTELKESIVAVIDSGAANIDYLQGHLTKGYDFVDNDNDASNDTHPNSHGTFLSSEIVDCVGTIPVKVMPVRVLSSLSGSLINAINGIHYAVDNGADVINISLGGKLDNCDAVEEAVNYATDNNVTVVVCSGNEHDDTEKYCPAHIPGAITVSSVNSESAFASSFSNYGDAVDFAAPGVDINGYNARGNIKTLSGTSMSTAYISAAAAMIKSVFPELNNKQLFEYLKIISEDRGEDGWDPYYGWGTINLQNTYKADKKWVTGVSLSQHELTLKIGDCQALISNVFPLDADNSKVKWISSDNKIVSVSDEGTLIAYSPGTAEISVCTSDGSYIDKCRITVCQAEPQSISIIKLPNKTEYKYGEPLSLDGIVVEAYYDGSIKAKIDSDELSVSGFFSRKSGNQIISVSYLGCCANFEINVHRTFWQTIIWLFSFQWVTIFLG